MTRTTNARIAGFTFLFYIATGVTAMVLFNQATGAGGIAAKLAGVAQHSAGVRLSVVLSLVMVLNALVLAVTLYAITRDEDPDLALLALSCRIGEGVINAIPVIATVGLLWVATGAVGAAASDAAAANALGAFLFEVLDWCFLIGATVFAVGSTLFAYLFLRARSIPVWLAWLGVVGSVLLVVFLPAQLAGLISGLVTDLIWVPLAIFEVVLGFWLLIKGVAVPEMR
ncbi:MAG: DUF4386 domain-containing protein [Gemmatimonadetes bacterium]|uniref:DUF4386 domain-containing protein n=1 Tax=Candidatus Kutchimonas denitrificans TaxID=3056748 RepID=A0AAE5C9K7_9BACT|nr:DUF4386 domain-containing protein [Gemmatimonadota bacterium]NIR75586.1 DUF4386 domain-containing protein [Candidatus Kutchimonas denitrificans]NIS01900.1 DUF4386 domain-containing protein [Gemmatimonadota bacterium]NIT67681.1 DUF4386 domain-containing protein [Gemmatimonadota bacterium]NIU53555.1 DUF4386 family protein [Gemmatimonadota bacterium]